MSDYSNANSNLSKTKTPGNGLTTNGSLAENNLHPANGAIEKDNTFGATVIKSRAVNYLLTKLRSKDTSGRVSVCKISLLIRAINYNTNNIILDKEEINYLNNWNAEKYRKNSDQ